VRIIKGHFNGDGLRIGIVVSHWNEFITKQLLDGALDNLQRHGVHDRDITVLWVPGSFELPLACRKLAERGAVDAVIALGAVIRGATSHYDYVAGNAASGVAQVAMQTGVPCIFGVLTTDTIEQAIERAGTKAGNKGADCLLAAIETADVLRQVRAKS
jgi:6,7-dimethyl-8-ribityllumazine synthase